MIINIKGWSALNILYSGSFNEPPPLTLITAVTAAASVFSSSISIKVLCIITSTFNLLSEVFEKLTSSDLMDNITVLIEKRVALLDDILKKEVLLSAKIDDNIDNNEKLSIMLKDMTLNMSTTIRSFEQQKDSYVLSAQLLNNSIEKLNGHMDNLSSDNLKAIYSNIIKSIETMKSDMEKIEWKFKQGLDEYDAKFTDKLQNSLESIDQQTVKIIEDLTEFKELSK